MNEFRRSKLYDLLAVSPLIGWYAFGIAKQGPYIAAQVAAVAQRHAAQDLLALVSVLTTLAFLGLQIVLFLIRRAPQAHAEGILPRLAAAIGANLQVIILAVPRLEGHAALAAAATALTIAGTGGSIFVAFWLGRSFSVFPQARRLVVKGPYRYVRHPLYLCEQVASLGVVLQYTLPWSLVIGAASLAAQFPRMHYEERILSRCYPEYRDYAARTWRLVPYLY